MSDDIDDTRRGECREQTEGNDVGETRGGHTRYPAHDDTVRNVQVDDHVKRSALISVLASTLTLRSSWICRQRQSLTSSFKTVSSK